MDNLRIKRFVTRHCFIRILSKCICLHYIKQSDLHVWSKGLNISNFFSLKGLERTTMTFNEFFLVMLIINLLLPSICENREISFDRLMTPKCSQSKSCPHVKSYDLWQNHCKYSCPDEMMYTCLENDEDEQITEFCSPILLCEAGILYIHSTLKCYFLL